MNNRKRQRLETVAGPNCSADLIATKCDEQNMFLTSNNIENNDAMSGDVYFTICDENSNSSQKYYTITETDLAQIKQEKDMSLETLPLPYRVINETSRNLLNSSTAVTNKSPQTGLATAVQLPSGCEIYLVKEYVESNSPEHDEANKITSNVNNKINVSLNSNNCFETKSNLNVNNLTNAVSTLTGTKATAGTVAVSATADLDTKRKHILLETYKKRDDKRRATHNEVERRRRDKINNWIFRLKEMLPTEIPRNISGSKSKTLSTLDIHSSDECSLVKVDKEQLAANKMSNISNSNNTTTNGRSPPSDSKSQILIKACEYIKVLQEEVISLRECLTENEELRRSNQQLQNELNKLKNEQGNNITNNNLNNTSNIYNNLFGASTNSTHIKSVPGGAILLGNGNNSSGGNISTTSAYTKRELIITDYVD
ncbi:uncharacterized protein DDB_G0288805 [Teleopsis dalmanni]|uniref:uncharacterized protein DDB_G0288805 n=1 Tax=Teleopsis dalmanni TaxID=139649 RepID=UPI000D32C785|nr:uncharacterized protein DDB_G0288805 [Teleopsis dalmanni]